MENATPTTTSAAKVSGWFLTLLFCWVLSAAILTLAITGNLTFFGSTLATQANPLYFLGAFLFFAALFFIRCYVKADEARMLGAFQTTDLWLRTIDDLARETNKVYPSDGAAPYMGSVDRRCLLPDDDFMRLWKSLIARCPPQDIVFRAGIYAQRLPKTWKRDLVKFLNIRHVNTRPILEVLRREEAIKKFDDLVKKLQAEGTTLQAENKGLKDENTKLQASNKRYETEVTAFKNNATKLADENQSLRNDNQSSREKIQTLTSELNSLQRELALANEEIARLNKNVDDLAKVINQRNEVIKNLNQVLAQLKQKEGDNSKVIEALQNQITQLTQEKEQFIEALRRYTQTLNSIKQCLQDGTQKSSTKILKTISRIMAN